LADKTLNCTSDVRRPVYGLKASVDSNGPGTKRKKQPPAKQEQARQAKPRSKGKDRETDRQADGQKTAKHEETNDKRVSKCEPIEGLAHGRHGIATSQPCLAAAARGPRPRMQNIKR